MLIRREVYFSAIDEYGDERLYSTTELVDEDSYLAELMYSDDEDEEDSLIKGALKGAGITAGTIAGAGGLAYGAEKGSAALLKKTKAGAGERIKALFKGDFAKARTGHGKVGRGVKKAQKFLKNKEKELAKYWKKGGKNKAIVSGALLGTTLLGAGAGAYGSRKKD